MLVKVTTLICLAVLSLGVLFHTTGVSSNNTALGIFEDHRDIGPVKKAGSVQYDAAKKTYLITGGGENVWGAADGFHFIWKQLSDDVTLASDISWIGTAGNEHRKACLMIRQSLDPDAAYADAVVHGNGLTSLQFREVKGGPTHQMQIDTTAPHRIRIEREGDYVFMSIAPAGQDLHSASGSVKVKLTGPFFVGLGVCAHDNNVSEKALFSNVEITNEKKKLVEKPALESTLETITISNKDRKVVHHIVGHFEAPNWSRDGKYFLYNQDGHIYKLPVTGGKPEVIDSGASIRCNNDHGISPDGTQLVISDQSQEDHRSSIYVLPIGGGTPRRITKFSPSYWHGWSPDGKTLAYCAQRNNEFDIYSISVDGGEEKQLTTVKGLDDGPDYSPDGQYIYFNSVRSGLMQIWRMKADGSEQTQITKDDYNNWFAHPSPDGKWIVFVTFEKDVDGHPANKDVMIRIMPVGGGEIQVLAKLFGGQGTINVPSWSPDSKNVAFVSYRLVNP
jgi:TolB protein